MIISTLPRRVAKWLRRELPKRVEALGIRVDVITPERDRSIRDKMGVPPGGPL